MQSRRESGILYLPRNFSGEWCDLTQEPWFQTQVINTVKKTIEEYNMISRNDFIVCGISGGPDSICLLHVLAGLSGAMGFKLHVGYLHHHMRKEADEDAKMVVDFAASLGVRATVGHEDVPALARKLGLGVEEAGRIARYTFLRALKREIGATKIAVGHNMNDQAETVLMRLLRGSGVQGLSGIPPVSGDIIRPLIDVPRAWTEGYCSEANLKVITDVYNLDLKYERNMIRHKIMPELADLFNPSLVETLSRTSKVLRWDHEFLDGLAQERFMADSVKEGRVTLVNRNNLLNAPRAISSRVLEKAWQECSGERVNFEYKNVVDLFGLIARGEGNLMLPGKIVAGIYRDFLGFFPEVGEVDVPLKVPGSTDVPELGVSIQTRVYPGTGCLKDMIPKGRTERYFFVTEPRAWVDFQKVEGALNKIRVRNRRPGDRFSPYGMGGQTKKLQDFFTSIKVPRFYRDLVPLVTVDNLVVAVLGHRVSESFKVEPNSEKVLEMEVKPYLRQNEDRATIV